MKNLLPDFILENYKNNKFEGRINAFTMFLDISGFTPMTEKLMKGGNEGAEILSEILKKIFKPTVKNVYDQGGFITNYAGDSFTSIFPIFNKNNPINDQASRTLFCAKTILSAFQNSGIQKTKYGNFDLRAKIGLAFGEVEWAIIGESLKSFYFRGDAIIGCAIAQKTASENELIINNTIYKVLNNNKNISLSRRGNFYFVKKIIYKNVSSNASTRKLETSNLTKQIFSKNFFPETVFSVKDAGEFRNAVSVFISFDPSLSKDIIDSLFRIIIDSVSHYAGYLKDIDFGDKGGVIVCYFGAPLSHEEDIDRSLNFVNFAKKKISDSYNLNHIKLKIGITYGKVYSGFIGAEERVQYSVIGDVVNLSARFMSKANWDEVWISEEIYQRIKNKSDFKLLGYHQFKGFSKEIAVYKLIEKESEVIRRLKSNKVKKLTAPSKAYYTEMIIGRDEELKKMNKYAKDIFEKKSAGVIFILGEAGIGKSRLVKEFKKEFTQSNKINWLYCYTSEISKRPLSPFKYLLKNFFKQSVSNTADENKSIFDNTIDIIIKRLEIILIQNQSERINVLQIKNELERTRSIIAAMIDIFWKNSLYENLEPELRFENTLFALCNLIMAECLIQPVVIEIEDIHWLDKDSIEVLKILLNNINLPLVIICTSRHLLQGKSSPLEAAKIQYKIELNYFIKDDIKKFVEQILNGDVDTDAVDFIYKNTNGNPYFVEQLILDLKERDIWKKKNMIYTLSEYDELNIPSSVNSVLISRFDRLPEDVKNIIQTASVIGKEFEVKVLELMLSGDKDLNSKIKMAEEEKIWYPANETKYVFTHSLLSNAVYGLQMKSEVNDMHLRVADSIKKLSGKKISQNNSEQIVYHLGIGNNIVDSKGEIILTDEKFKNKNYFEIINEYLNLQINIANKYKTEYINEKALELYDLVLSLLSKLKNIEQSYFILLKKVEILNNISKWDEAKKAVEKALKFAEQLKDRSKKEHANKYLAEIYRYKNEYVKSLDLFRKVLKYFSSTEENHEILNLLSNIGNVYFVKGDYKNALHNFKLQLTLAQKLKNKVEISKSVYSIGIIYNRKGEYKRALEYFNKSLKSFSRHDDKRFIGSLYRAIGNLHFFQGDYKKAYNFFEQARKIFYEIGNKHEYGIIIGNIGNVFLTFSNIEKAKPFYEEQLKIFKSINNIYGLAASYFNLGYLFLETGKYDDALQYFKLYIKICEKLKKRENISFALGNIGNIYQFKGDYDKAIRSWNEQLKIDESFSNREGIIRGLFNIADVYNKKNFLKAGYYCTKAIELAKKYGIKKNLAILFLNYGEYLLKSKKFKKGINVCDESLKINNNNFNVETIILTKILKEKIYIFENLDKIKSKRSIDAKLNNHVGKIVLHYKKCESLLKNLRDEEFIAESHYDLFIIACDLKKMNIVINSGGIHMNKSIEIYKKLIANKPKYVFKTNLENLERLRRYIFKI